jgi:hypothetical protein
MISCPCHVCLGIQPSQRKRTYQPPLIYIFFIFSVGLCFCKYLLACLLVLLVVWLVCIMTFGSFGVVGLVASMLFCDVTVCACRLGGYRIFWPFLDKSPLKF